MHLAGDQPGDGLREGFGSGVTELPEPSCTTTSLPTVVCGPGRCCPDTAAWTWPPSTSFNAETVRFSEINEPGARVFAHHWRDAPNLGDVTDIDWNDVPPVDILCGGFPCQDGSTVGKQAGLAPGTRAGLWSHMAAAIDALQPEFVVIENVRGLLSAPAVCNLPEGAIDARSDPATVAPGDDAAATLREAEPRPVASGRPSSPTSQRL